MRTLGLAALGVLYVVSPADLMPEGVFAVLGLADDALVLAWLVSTLVNETEGFLRWESAEAPTAADGPVTVRSTVIR